jgi:hypothetical protein
MKMMPFRDDSWRVLWTYIYALSAIRSTIYKVYEIHIILNRCKTIIDLKCTEFSVFFVFFWSVKSKFWLKYIFLSCFDNLKQKRDCRYPFSLKVRTKRSWRDFVVRYAILKSLRWSIFCRLSTKNIVFDTFLMNYGSFHWF